MLPDTEQIATALLEKIEPINTEGDFDDLILRRRKDRPSATETAYLQAFPKEFSEFVARFDLDHFSIGNIDFGRGSYFDFLVETNKVDEFGMGWWGKGDRPAHLHLIATSDPHSIIIDNNNGKIHAIDENSRFDEFILATGFDLFFRCVGSKLLGKISIAQAMTLSASNCVEFWENIPSWDG